MSASPDRPGTPRCCNDPTCSFILHEGTNVPIPPGERLLMPICQTIDPYQWGDLSPEELIELVYIRSFDPEFQPPSEDDERHIEETVVQEREVVVEGMDLQEGEVVVEETVFQAGDRVTEETVVQNGNTAVGHLSYPGQQEDSGQLGSIKPEQVPEDVDLVVAKRHLAYLRLSRALVMASRAKEEQDGGSSQAQDVGENGEVAAGGGKNIGVLRKTVFGERGGE